MQCVYFKFLLLLAQVGIFANGSRSHRKSYIAAVVEYQPIPYLGLVSPQETLHLNADAYVKFIGEAKFHNADIIVFPEYGLTSLQLPKSRRAARPFLVSVPKLGQIPCLLNNSASVLQKLSCAARTQKIYVIVNLGEILPCSACGDASCPTDGNFQYNTNIVFGRDGEIIAKYHKYNLYFENQFDSPQIPEQVTFETDFGVIFGTFICFDIMFYSPTVDLVRSGIKNFILTTAWVDELPFLMATQSNADFAMSGTVNLLAAGYHNPDGGQLGSGIFSGSIGPLNHTFDPNSGSRMIIAEVPNTPNNVTTFAALSHQFAPKPAEHFFLEEDLREYSTTVLELTSGTTETCHKNLCCSLTYKLESISKTFLGGYRLIAFSGFRKTARETAEFGWQVCGVIRCVGDTVDSCTEKSRAKSQPNFSSFQLWTHGMEVDRPMKPSLNTLDINFQPVHYEKFEIIRQRGLVEVKSSKLDSTPLQTLALINRIYHEDQFTNEVESASSCSAGN